MLRTPDVVPAVVVVQVDYQQYPKGSSPAFSWQTRREKSRNAVKLCPLKKSWMTWVGLVWVVDPYMGGGDITPSLWLPQLKCQLISLPLERMNGNPSGQPSSTLLIAAEEFGTRVRDRTKRDGQPGGGHELFKEKDIKSTQIRSTTCMYILFMCPSTWFWSRRGCAWVIGSFYCCLVCFNFAFWLWVGFFRLAFPAVDGANFNE